MPNERKRLLSKQRCIQDPVNCEFRSCDLPKDYLHVAESRRDDESLLTHTSYAKESHLCHHAGQGGRLPPWDQIPVSMDHRLHSRLTALQPNVEPDDGKGLCRNQAGYGSQC